MTTSSSTSRNVTIDLLKAVAMQVIVLHHFVSYGPLAEAAHEAFPGIAGWLYEYGRVAVQIFLVIGGYLAARALSPRGAPLQDGLSHVVVKRYLRLVPPYAVALVLAVVCAAVARRHIDDDVFISAAPTFAQFVAHLLLLHDVFGYESLSTGVWYVAIDFQLFVMLALILWAMRMTQGARFIPALVALLAGVSVLYINLDSDWDAWAPYFFGTYALGVLAWWTAADVPRARGWWLTLSAVVVVALLIEFRWRPLVALVTAGVLHLSPRLAFWPVSHRVTFLARTSYALFLAHFPVFMLVSAWAVRLDHAEGWHAGAALVVAWGGSVALAYVLHRFVEATRHGLPFLIGTRRT